MKLTKHPLYYRNDSLRVQVLRRTVPKSYFKQKSKLFRSVTRDAAMQILNDLKRATKKQKPADAVTPKKNSDSNDRLANYKMIAINIVKRISGKGESPMKPVVGGEKTTVVDEKTGTVAKLLYL
jgi:hypothetical protein